APLDDYQPPSLAPNTAETSRCSDPAFRAKGFHGPFPHQFRMSPTGGRIGGSSLPRKAEPIDSPPRPPTWYHQVVPRTRASAGTYGTVRCHSTCETLSRIGHPKDCLRDPLTRPPIQESARKSSWSAPHQPWSGTPGTFSYLG